MKSDLFQSVVTAEVSKSAGILSVELSKHLLGLETVYLDIHHLRQLDDS